MHVNLCVLAPPCLCASVVQMISVPPLCLRFLSVPSLNVSSLIGLILLVGLIVKNGIILLDFTRRRMRTGGLKLEAAFDLFPIDQVQMGG